MPTNSELPLEDALKRAYYYDETGEWRPLEATDWDRWHAVAKVALTATTQSAPAAAEQSEYARRLKLALKDVPYVWSDSPRGWDWLVDKLAAHPPAAPVPADLMQAVEQILDVGHMNQEDLARLRIAWEASAPAQAPPSLAVGEAPEGWQLVPVEPTGPMTFAGQQMRYHSVNSMGAIYRAMLAAAPQETK